jgi:hypothetical protein
MSSTEPQTNTPEPAEHKHEDVGKAEATSSTPAPEIKGHEFNLKPNETQTLVISQQNHQSTFAALLSMIAVERLGYNVTQNTQFKLNAELTKMELTELPPVPQAQVQTEEGQPPVEDKPASPVVPA